jgi:hypothetical protein
MSIGKSNCSTQTDRTHPSDTAALTSSLNATLLFSFIAIIKSRSPSFFINDIFSAHDYCNDILFLLSKNNIILKLKKETDEIYSLISPIHTPTDTLYMGDKFFAWTIRYPNGQTKQSGGWNMNGQKDGAWMYYDSTGNEIRKRSFKNGILMDDNFKWDWEK